MATFITVITVSKCNVDFTLHDYLLVHGLFDCPTALLQSQPGLAQLV